MEPISWKDVVFKTADWIKNTPKEYRETIRRYLVTVFILGFMFAVLLGIFIWFTIIIFIVR